MRREASDYIYFSVTPCYNLKRPCFMQFFPQYCVLWTCEVVRTLNKKRSTYDADALHTRNVHVLMLHVFSKGPNCQLFCSRYVPGASITLRLFCLVYQRCTLLPSAVSPHITCQNNYHFNSDRVGYLGNRNVCHPGLSDNFLKCEIFFQESQCDITRLIHLQNYIHVQNYIHGTEWCKIVKSLTLILLTWKIWWYGELLIMSGDGRWDLIRRV
jgi:hypothetical protein